MKFNQGYIWFVTVAFIAGVICCFLPQHPASSVDSSAPNIQGTDTPTYTYAPKGDLPKKHEFDKYNCTLDCSGHKAGYEWAERKSIDDRNDCDVAGEHFNSPSFAEGCHAYVDGESEPDDDE